MRHHKTISFLFSRIQFRLLATSVKSSSSIMAKMEPKLEKTTKWTDSNGEYKRKESSFREMVEKGGSFAPASGRYHLYVSYACPWAHRCMITRALKGLEDVISFSVVDWYLGPEGWRFSSNEECPGSTIDTINNVKYVQELYYKADPNYNARFTVPILWDKQEQTIVNNESAEITRMLNEAFDEFSSAPGTSYYPESLRSEIDSLNEWILSSINNGVYKAGFATAQGPYEQAVKEVFEAMDRVESILATKQYLTGDTFTEADIRLFTSMYRFDPVYHTHFKCTNKTITNNYPHILRWLREIYHMPGIAATCNMDHTKNHYYKSHKNINPTGIVPIWDGPNLD